MKKQSIIPFIFIIPLTILSGCTQSESQTLVVPAKSPQVSVEVVVPSLASLTGETNSGISSTTGNSLVPKVLTRKETVKYKNPGGDDEIEFDVTVTDGIITAAKALPKAEHEMSKKRQETFAEELSEKVVGKNAKDLDIDPIGGSSLTTAAFEEFVHSF